MDNEPFNNLLDLEDFNEIYASIYGEITSARVPMSR